MCLRSRGLSKHELPSIAFDQCMSGWQMKSVAHPIQVALSDLGQPTYAKRTLRRSDLNHCKTWKVSTVLIQNMCIVHTRIRNILSRYSQTDERTDLEKYKDTYRHRHTYRNTDTYTYRQRAHSDCLFLDAYVVQSKRPNVQVLESKYNMFDWFFSTRIQTIASVEKYICWYIWS